MIFVPRLIIGSIIFATLSIGGSGCTALDPKPIRLAPECTAACGDVPCQCRGKVYVFLISGFDPLGLDRVGDFRTALMRSGFTKVYDGQFYHDRFFAQEMRRIVAEEPDARFVVVGFSLGADVAVSLADYVGKEGIPIALLTTVDPYWWSSAPGKTPANVQQVMNIHGERLFMPQSASAGMEVQIPETFPNNITANPLTVESLAHALAKIAGSLPPPVPSAEPQLADDAPMPRPLARTGKTPDPWDFLKPIVSLRGFLPGDSATSSAPSAERTSLRPVQPPSAN